ncbi:peptidoglycan-binding protein [Pseudosulfitobacter sp. SM2401]|uniref:peptidoglycan-binding domain-containing protein n=1 Tax=Pseudosulfitobacter sp. SM2401 TaxID=3350098 RepID=UPI0036F377CC
MSSKSINALGLDAGPVDGLFGTKTKNAVDLLRKQDAFAEVPSVNRGNAVVLCRTLAEIDRTLDRFFPSVNGVANAELGSNLNVGTAALTRSAFDQTISDLLKLVGLKLPLPIEFFFSNDTSELTERSFLAFNKKISKAKIRRRWSSLCQGMQFTGAMSPELIIVCGASFDRNSSPSRLPAKGIRILIAHESAHNIQYQLSGAEMRDGLPLRRIRGERWLIEAIAQAIALELIEGPEIVQSSLEKGSVISLSDLKELIKKERFFNEDYDALALLLWRLTKGRSAVEALKYFENLGLGDTEKRAFERTFGITKPQFLSKVSSEP